MGLKTVGPYWLCFTLVTSSQVLITYLWIVPVISPDLKFHSLRRYFSSSSANCLVFETSPRWFLMNTPKNSFSNSRKLQNRKININPPVHLSLKSKWRGQKNKNFGHILWCKYSMLDHVRTVTSSHRASKSLGVTPLALLWLAKIRLFHVASVLTSCPQPGPNLRGGGTSIKSF